MRSLVTSDEVKLYLALYCFLKSLYLYIHMSHYSDYVYIIHIPLIYTDFFNGP